MAALAGRARGTLRNHVWKHGLQRLLVPKYNPQVVSCADNFWEPDRKSGYKTKIKRTTVDLVKEGFKEIGPEVAKFGEEWKANFRCDKLIDIRPGDYETVWKFDNTDVIDSWTLTTDADHNEGQSSGEFLLGPSKTAVFKGKLDSKPPKDGKTKYAGYCNVKSARNMISFKRASTYDWFDYTHLLMRVRGDGRTYQISLGVDGYFDVSWNNQYSYALFTRGGPYWQIAKIPFSKFYLGAKGRIQDRQEPIYKDKVTFMGITIGDDVNGPFQLEIDYVGIYYDASHKEEFAYEMYEVKPYMLF